MNFKMCEVKTDNFIDRSYTFYTAGKNGREKRTVDFYRSDRFPENLFDIHLRGVFEEDEDWSELAQPDYLHSEKVLITVARIIQDFLTRYPAAVLHCIGYTPALKRLHQITIKSLYDQLQGEYEIYGRESMEWGRVEKESTYEEHVFFKKHISDVSLDDKHSPEVNCVSAKLARKILAFRSDPYQKKKEELFFEFFMKHPLPEPVRRRLIMKRPNDQN